MSRCSATTRHSRSIWAAPTGQYTMLAVIAVNGNVRNPDIRRIPVVIASDR
jgi:hypothetical protein